MNSISSFPSTIHMSHEVEHVLLQSLTRLERHWDAV